MAPFIRHSEKAKTARKEDRSGLSGIGLGVGQGRRSCPQKSLRKFLEVVEFFIVVVTPLCTFVTTQITVDH